MPAKLREWLKAATLSERKQVVKLAGIGEVYLDNIRRGDNTPALATAVNIARATRIIRAKGGREAKERLPLVTRGDVSPVCAGCAYFQICAKSGITEDGKNEKVKKEN